MLVCVFFAHLAHETAGAVITRHSLLPLLGDKVDGKARALCVARSQALATLSSSAKADDPVIQRQ
ncbi:hypothetical protein CQ10_11420 [Bradyrhizobium valentinum]|nr:hypothetical protein CQ10_11420 [Bradyrhizobium valentinum]